MIFPVPIGMFKQGPGFLLDKFPGAQRLFGFKKYRTGETTPLTIRRSSDDAEAIVFYNTSDDLSLSSLINLGGTLGTWIGSDDGFISFWRDQTGNGGDETTSTIAQQRQIIFAGVLKVNAFGEVAAENNATRFGNLTTINLPLELNQFIVFEALQNATNDRFLTSDAFFTTFHSNAQAPGNRQTSGTSNQFAGAAGSMPSGTPALMEYQANTTDRSVFVNDVVDPTTTAGNQQTRTNLSVGLTTRANLTQSALGMVSLILHYDNNQTSNRSAIAQEIMTLQSIP